MIQSKDLMKTVRWLMSLSPAACVREVVVECRSDIEEVEQTIRAERAAAYRVPDLPAHH